VELIFLGTGGGRFVTITQKRRTAGIRLVVDGFHAHLDPGPGALVHSIGAGLNPQKLRAILVSHAHPDHYNDAEVMIEAMTRGATKRRGVLIAPRSVLTGNETCGPVISRYHQGIPEAVYEVKPGDEVDLGALRVLATRAVHTDPDTVGFRFHVEGVGDVAYTSDTSYFEGIGEYYRGTRLLILCVMRPTGEPWKGHMSTDDAIKILNDTHPEMAIITHFGMKMVFKGPRGEAKLLERETGVPTVAAEDGMRVEVKKEIQVISRREAQRGLAEFMG